MKIRNKLTYQFVGIVASVLLFASIAIYILFSQFRERDFYIRLNEKAVATAKLLLETNDVDETLLKLIDKNLLGILPQERVIIINQNGTVIYKTDDEQVINLSDKLISDIKQNKTLRFTRDDFEFIGIVYNYNNVNYTVIAGAHDKYGFRKLRFLGVTLLLILAISLLVVYLSGWIYAGRALQPISQIIKEVESFSVAKLDNRIDEGNGQDELSQLAKTFNKLLEQIEEAFKAQRSFVGNASHELRNPLSLIRGQIEVSLLKDREKSDYRKTMESVLEDINRLTSISNRLLSLAQVSGVATIDPVKPIRIDELLMQVQAELLEGIPEYKVAISFEQVFENEASLTVSGNERLLKIAFFNLMENGCKYSNDHSCKVDIGIEDSNIIIHFKDEGLGIPEEDLKNIFEPFYRSKNAFDRKGHGIGLSLVDRIIKLHKGTVSIVSTLSVGSTFSIKLPTYKF